MADDRTLDEVISSARIEGRTLRRNAAGWAPARVDEILDEIERVTEEYRRFVPEQEAQLRSGRSAAWLRAQFPAWQQAGHAELRHGKRYYRLLIVPARGDAVSARAAGLRGDRRTA